MPSDETALLDAAIHEFSPRVRKIVTQANPGAGADWTVAVPGQWAWRVLSINATLTASAAVANRQVSFLVTDQTTTAYQFGNQASITANQAVVLSVFEGASTVAAANPLRVNWSLPSGLLLYGGWQLKTSTANVDVADQWSAISVLVLEGEIGMSKQHEERRAYSRLMDEGALVGVEGA